MADSSYTLINSAGTVVSDTSDVQDDVVSNVVDSLGVSQSVAENSSTTEGRLVELLTYARQSLSRNNAKLANQINPNLAEDGFFDSIYALFGGSRTAATRSQVTVSLTGVSGTVIDSGSYIRNSSTSTLWYTSADITLDSNGEGSVIAYSDDTGAITADAGDLTEIVSQVTGWETVTNDSAATEGSDEQSLSSAKVSRIVELAKNAGTTAKAVISNVSALDDVIGVSFRENRLSTSQTIDGVTIPGKTTWLCVDGGDSDEIIEQYCIHTHGTGFYTIGDNTVTGTFTDSYSTQETTVVFDTPTEVPIKIQITASLTSSTDLVSSVKEAVQEWAAGNVDGYIGCMLANVISPFEISSALNSYFSAASIYVSDVQVTTVADDSLGYTPIPIAIWEKATITNANITVVEA